MNEGYTHQVKHEFRCASCEYPIRGVAVDSLCPECGTPIQHSIQRRGQPASGYAITSLVLGIVSIMGCMFYGLPSIICGPLAIYFGITAKKQIARGERNTSSRGMAQAGIICGIIGTSLASIVLVFILLAIFGVIAGGVGFGP